MNFAIILSGGTGSRVGGDVPKQYLKVKDKYVFQYSAETLFSCACIDYVIFVAAWEWQGLIKANIPEDCIGKFKGFAEPGKTRQLSILNALKCAESFAEDFDNVIVHDAARPFVKAETIEELISALNEADGAIPMLPMKDTVYTVKTGMIEGLLDRPSVMAGQAPEGFKFGEYLAANEALLPEKIRNINGSSEVAFLAGMSIKCIPGDEGNTKITTSEDLKRWQDEGL